MEQNLTSQTRSGVEQVLQVAHGRTIHLTVSSPKLTVATTGSRKGEESAVCPPHPGTIHGICIRCGATVASQEATTEEHVGLK